MPMRICLPFMSPRDDARFYQLRETCKNGCCRAGTSIANFATPAWLRRLPVFRKTLALSLLTILTAAALPTEAEAQRRAVRRPTVRRSVVYVAARPYYRPYYRPFYAGFYSGWYSGWYGSGFYGWPGWYPYGMYGQYYPPYGYGYRYDYAGAARIEVKPREAEVYVDGFLVGSVDDFDGWLQRLHVAPGEHEIQIYLPGHRTMRERVLFRPGATLRITGALEPLPSGSADEPRPTPAPGAEQRLRGERYGDSYPEARGEYPPERAPREGQRAPAPERPSAENFGALAIRVQPGDAEVFIDGDRWETPPTGERLTVQLSEGEHRIEIRRGGYRTYTSTIQVRRGETVPLNVSLSRQDAPEYLARR
jgi:hypothetical protein